MLKFELFFLRTNPPEVFLGKAVLKKCSKFIGVNCRIETVHRHGSCPVNLLHIFRHLFLGTPLKGCFLRCTWLLLQNIRLQLH